MVVVLRKRAVAALIVLVGVVFLITSNTFWRWMYPIGYQPEIRQAAAEAGVDPLLVASVIRVESQFRSGDVSHAGAIGLMQLMPDTAQWLVDRIRSQTGSSDLPPGGAMSPAELSDPAVNIRVGTWYIRYLMDRFQGNPVAAIAAYNSGPKRVSQWLADGTWNGRLSTASEIPVGETRHFVGRVFYNYELYKRIYGTDPAWRTS
ncbi:lytic transglycosylase domain-containing protein [Alicyclobacillus sp.]|uniref:lytic transglycosylase domain-containing protein n=1 Tax=Alicyclobacillus sp. TaxID=61169 RepID=UPI0025B8CE86|nr:lytic transglycosylase domain-containing protein [Alicyclobacillus sp.]MCL6517646.1 lytic transglycosylase domain-containing protein [Alicyclobacillus sp.]